MRFSLICFKIWESTIIIQALIGSQIWITSFLSLNLIKSLIFPFLPQFPKVPGIKVLIVVVVCYTCKNLVIRWDFLTFTYSYYVKVMDLEQILFKKISKDYHSQLKRIKEKILSKIRMFCTCPNPWPHQQLLLPLLLAPNPCNNERILWSLVGLSHEPSNLYIKK